MAAILTPRVVRRIVGECTDVDERGAVGIRLEPAAAIDENQDGTRGSNLLCSSAESANYRFRAGLPTLGSDRQQPVGL